MCDITLRTGLGSGTFDVNIDIPVVVNTSIPAACQSYWVRAHLTMTSTIVSYKECGGSVTQVTVTSENEAYICAEVGAMPGGVDYIINQGNSNQVTEDNSGLNTCISQ
jgi:hypothetical protein